MALPKLKDPRGNLVLFTYDAAESSTRRTAPKTLLVGSDDDLYDSRRRRLVATARDLRNNLSLCVWAINRHLDYVSDFSFQSRSGDDDTDKLLEGLMTEWSKPENCDASGRHSLSDLTRMAEECRTVDGDVGMMKLATGALQPIMGDRVRDQFSTLSSIRGNVDNIYHGIKVDDAMRPLEYYVHRRTRSTSGGFEFQKAVPAEWMFWHGFYRDPEQVRGISPLAASINTFRDVYEANDYTLTKMKLSQYFGLTFYREAMGSVAPEVTKNDSEDDTAGYEVDFKKGPVVLDLDAGDRAEFLESKTPSTEFQNYLNVAISLALKALDIPYSFFDESWTNYSGARQALVMYEQSAKSKRRAVAKLLNGITAWRVSQWILDGKIDPKAPLKYEWVPAGIPWIDPLKEAQGNIAMLAAGVTSRQRICKSRGEDFFEIAAELDKEEEIRPSLKVPVPVPAEPSAPEAPQPRKRK